MNKPPRVPGTQNVGNHGPAVPPDLPYPCTIYECSHDTEHAPGCDETCDYIELTETQVKLQNLAREYARNGMSFVGIPQGVPTPIAGINVDLVELSCRIMAVEEILFELAGITREEFDEKYRETKIEFMQTILDQNKEAVRRMRTADALGIVRAPLLGPNGEQIG